MIWVILFWFAVLQAMSPLIHAHLEVDTPQQGHGIHMHTDEIGQIQDKIPTLKADLGFSDTIGVDKAVVEDIKFLPYPLLVFLFVIYLLITICQLSNHTIVNNQFSPLYLKSNAAPRAPPYF